MSNEKIILNAAIAIPHFLLSMQIMNSPKENYMGCGIHSEPIYLPEAYNNCEDKNENQVRSLICGPALSNRYQIFLMIEVTKDQAKHGE
jgi:hypothetical protein